MVADGGEAGVTDGGGEGAAGGGDGEEAACGGVWPKKEDFPKGEPVEGAAPNAEGVDALENALPKAGAISPESERGACEKALDPNELKPLELPAALESGIVGLDSTRGVAGDASIPPSLGEVPSKAFVTEDMEPNASSPEDFANEAKPEPAAGAANAEKPPPLDDAEKADGAGCAPNADG